MSTWQSQTLQEFTYAVDASDDDPSNQLLGSSITYRIAIGPQQGRKVFA
jgi:hypothetical protein